MGRPSKKIRPIQGQRLFEERGKTGLSQQGLAIKTGLEQRNISKYETNSVELPIYAAEKLGEAFGVRASYLRGIDDWRTWDDVPAEYMSKQFDKAWDSAEAAEKLLSALGYVFKRAGKIRQIKRRYIDDEGEKVFWEDDIHDPRAFHLIVDGEDQGLCSINQRDMLIETIADYAQFEAGKLLSRVQKRGADNG